MEMMAVGTTSLEAAALEDSRLRLGGGARGGEGGRGEGGDDGAGMGMVC